MSYGEIYFPASKCDALKFKAIHKVEFTSIGTLVAMSSTFFDIVIFTGTSITLTIMTDVSARHFGTLCFYDGTAA